MRSVHVVVLSALLFAAPVAGQDPCGTIDRMAATIEAGVAPAAGTVTIEPCPLEGVPPTLPPIGDLGTMGALTGTLPAFPGGGDESDGPYHATTSQGLPAGTYNHTTFKIDNGVTVTCDGPVTIHTTGDVDLDGVLESTTDDAPITISCAGFFRMTGVNPRARVETAGASSPITIRSYRIMRFDYSNIEAQHGDVAISSHHDTVGEGYIQFERGNVYARNGDVTVQSDSNVLNVRSTLSASGTLLVQSRAGTVYQQGTSWFDAEGSVAVEAWVDFDMSDGAYVETYEIPVSITALEGAVRIHQGGTVNSGDGDTTIRGETGVSVTDSIVDTGAGMMSITAFDGPVVFDDSNVRADAGIVEVKAKGDVELRTDGRVYSDENEVRIRSTEGSLVMDGTAELGHGSFPAGSVDVRTHLGIRATGSEARIRGAQVSLSCGTGGIDLDLDFARSDDHGLDIVTSGPVTLRGLFEGHTALDVATTGTDIDIAGATLTTSDRAGEGGDSGSISIESWAGPGGTIFAHGATVRSGTSDGTSGDVTLRIREAGSGPPPVAAVESFVLPKRVVVKMNAKDPARSKLIAAGFCDLGPKPIDLTAETVIDVGQVNATVDGLAPNRKGSKYLRKEPNLLVLIKPSRHGSSLAKFKLKMVGDFEGLIDPEGILTVNFGVDTMDGGAKFTLTKGKYALRKVRGGLVEPSLFLAKAKGRIKGAGKDSVVLILGLATAGATPPPSEVSVWLGDALVTIAADDFTRKGDRYDHKGAAARVTLDYAKEIVKIKLTGLDLGAIPEGASEIVVGIAVGADSRAVRVRMARKGASLRY